MSTPPESAPMPLGEPTGRPGDPSWYTRRFELGLYLVAGIAYVGFGIYNKWLLNWVVGPVWLVVWVWAVPVLLDRLRQR